MIEKREAVQAPLGQLERTFIDEYIRRQGYDPAGLPELRPDERERLLRDASVYASTRLMEVEARSHFLDDMHVKPE